MRSRSTLVRVFWLFILSAIVLAGCTDKGDSASKAASDDTSLDAAALKAMQIIEGQVSELRGLETLESVTKAFLTTDELRQRMTEHLDENYPEEEARDDVLLYVAFGLMEPDVDLRNLLIDLETEQVLGFYNLDTEEMYVVKGSEEPGALERMTYAHEYTHVLQDQHHDLQAMGFTQEDDDEDEDSEQQMAIRSLVEGDATLLMQQYMLQHFKADDIQEVLSQIAAVDTNVLDSAPEVIRQSLAFPYEEGLTFAVALFADGGWSAVDAAYANPPLSAEQIIHPERYPDDVPQIVTLPPLTDTLGPGWRLVDEDVMGEFGLQLYLKTHTDPSEAEAAADGWGGDRYTVHWRDDESGFVLALQSVWDTPEEAAEFFNTYARFAENRFGSKPTHQEDDVRLRWIDEDALLLTRNEQGDVLILIAPDEETLDAIYALFPSF